MAHAAAPRLPWCQPCGAPSRCPCRASPIPVAAFLPKRLGLAAVRVLRASTGCYAEGGPSGAGGGVRHLRILPTVADELYPIQVLHGDPSVSSPCQTGKLTCFPHEP